MPIRPKTQVLQDFFSPPCLFFLGIVAPFPNRALWRQSRSRLRAGLADNVCMKWPRRAQLLGSALQITINRSNFTKCDQYFGGSCFSYLLRSG
jgi:hypothetical protein